MEQFSQPLQNEELLSQTVTDAELREILERIGHDEFSGIAQPTIRDIAEGTSADPATIGRILGDIRKEDWEKRFGLELKDHEKRIGSLEAKQNPPPFASPQAIRQPITPPTLQGSTNYSNAPQYGYGSKRKNSSVAATVVAVIVFAIFALMLFGAFFTIGSTRAEVISGPMPTVHFDSNSNLSPATKRAVEESIRNGNLK